jgi:2-oxoisovalerate dehydrogenase E1 component
MRLVDSISDGLKEAMYKNDSLIIMGQDIAEYGGVFKITEGFVDLFGKDRVRNTPICESSIIEIAMGLSICNRKSIVELQFSDFITSGFNPVVNYLAKSNYRWGQNADIVLRMPCGAGVGAGPFHSQTNEAWFTKTPGLIVVYPSTPIDAKGLLISSIENPNPVLFFEHKALYRSIRDDVPNGYYNIEIGKAKLLNVGTDITIITYGSGVHESIKTIKKHSLSADLIDLRTLSPLDNDSIIQSVRKTGKAIILQEDSLFGGLASEISSIIMENCFENLDAPVIRVGSLDTPIPFEETLEKQYLPFERFESEILKLIDY